MRNFIHSPLFYIAYVYGIVLEIANHLFNFKLKKKNLHFVDYTNEIQYSLRCAIEKLIIFYLF